MEIHNGRHCVYIHTNKVNGKKYVGQTCSKPNARWRNGFGYRDSPHFFYAIQKYGWNSFDHEIVASHLTKEEANNFEMLLIKRLGTKNPEYGYNLTLGGDGNVGLTPSAETRQKISKSLKGRRTGKPSGMSGKTHTDEARRRISVSKRRKVLCVSTGIIYQSLQEAEMDTGVRYFNISAACSKKQETAGGYKWEYAS